jgi:ubiquitin-activating enzyme E1
VDSTSKASLTAEFLSTYTLVLATDISHSEQLKLSAFCLEKKVKFISADCFGAACRITNDYGKFEVLDKNGEEPVEVMIKDIECSERGLVTLLDGAKHPYEDGEAVVISQIEGMKLKEDGNKSINGIIRKVKVINFKSFEIGDTTMFEPYVRNGTAKNIKTPVTLEFPSLQKALDPLGPADVDQELEYFDFAKQPRSALLRLCFITLDQFRAN